MATRSLPSDAALLPTGTATVRRALAVLEAFKAQRRPIGLAELAVVTKVDKATLLRYLATLQEFRLVRREGDNYTLGLGAFELGAAYTSQLDLHAISRPYMDTLAESLMETISLAMLDGSEVVYIDVVRGQAEIGVQSRVGARQQAHCTSLGKSLTAWLPIQHQQEVLFSKPLERLTHNTLTDPSALRAHLGEVRAQGYAIDNEERIAGVRCVGAPIRDRTGAVVAAMSVSGAAFRLEGARMDQARDELLAVTDAISAQLGAPLLNREVRA